MHTHNMHTHAPISIHSSISLFVCPQNSSAKMQVQIMFEAVAVYMQGHQMDRTITTLQKLRDPTNKAFQEAIRRDQDNEQLPEKAM